MCSTEKLAPIDGNDENCVSQTKDSIINDPKVHRISTMEIRLPPTKRPSSPPMLLTTENLNEEISLKGPKVGKVQRATKH